MGGCMHGQWAMESLDAVVESAVVENQPWTVSSMQSALRRQ